MNPHIALTPEPTPATTWDALHAAVEAEAGGTSAAELSAEQVVLVAAAAGVEPGVVGQFVDAHAVAGALEVDVDVDVLFALVSEGVAADAGALAAVGDDARRTAIERAVAGGTIPDAGVTRTDKTAKALMRVSLDRQPVFLAQPAALYATTDKAAHATDQTGALVSDRLGAALRTRVGAALGKVSPELAQALHPLIARLDWRQVADRDVADIARELLATAGDAPALAAETSAVARKLDAPPPRSVRDALHLDTPLAENPALAADVARGKAVEYAHLAGLSDAATRNALAAAQALAEGTTAGLDLELADAAALRRVVDLAQLTGDNLPLMRALDERGETDPAALARLSRADWERLIAEHNVPLPPDATMHSYADALAHNLETVFPTQALAARLEDPQVKRLYANNPDLDLRSVDLVLQGSANLDWTGIPTTEQAAVAAQLRAHQRVIALAPTSDLQVTLLERRFDSALAIARETQTDFVAKSGLPAADAQDVYARALIAATRVGHSYGAIRDVVRGLFDGLAVGNVAPELVNDLRRIEGFSDLFGPQDFCDCRDCNSVLSPAAYFCDLMYFVEQRVSRPVFVNVGQANHPLHLKTRRPDLWTLQLTCDNTETLVPYLTIVDEVLEAFLGTIVGGDIYATLADPEDRVSFCTPFVLPWAELTLYLSHFSLTPADVYESLQLADGKVWRARLGLAPVEAQVVTTPDSANVTQRIGSRPLNDLDVQEFLRLTGLSRSDLDAVLGLRSFTDLAQIVVAKQKTPDELQNFPEILQKLTATRLDLIHRFLRLQRATPWAIADLDLVVLAAREGGLAGADIDETLVETLGQLVELQTKLKLTVEEVCCLADGLPVSAAFPLQPARTSDLKLYERLFDLPKLFGLANTSTGELNQTVSFRDYSLDTVNPGDTTIDPKTPLLLAGLGISETELLLLFDLLKDELPFDANGNCTLDRAKLSLLYRHVRVGRALRFAVDDLIRALQLLFAPGSEPLKTLAQLRTLIDFRAWLHGSPFSTSELRFILAGVESPTAKFSNTPDAVAQLVQQVQALGTTGRVDLLKGQLAPLFNLTGARLEDQLKWIAADITALAIQTALDTTFTNGVPDTPSELDPLVTLVQQLERVALLFSNLKLEDDSIHWLTANANALGIADLAPLTLHDVQSLTFYRSLATFRDGVEPEVREALAAYVAAGTVSPGADRERLADLWQVDTTLVDSLVDVLPLPAAAIDALARLSDGLDLCGTLGVNGYSLQKLGDDTDYAALKTASDVVLGTFAAKYDDETVRETTLEPYQDRINVAKRDALCDYVIARQPELKFRDHGEIYDYFLLDVDMSGCFRTSRVVCAISSVQLYVQRCTLNLERSDPALSPAIPERHVDPSRIPAEQWEWRKNYRVWEANREVFLYPEAYLDQTLRDDTTPICQDLEDNLLQQKVTKDTAADAYERYVAAFAELAHLRICGSLRYQGTYYFFGATQQDPPVFFYRTWDEKTWSAWKKIDLAIEAPYVAATVHLGRLYIFWVNGKSKEKTSISGGSEQPAHYEVHVDLAYSYLNPEGKWISPQKLAWLYPSESEDTSAPNKISDPQTLTEMELSKSYRKTYPSVVGDAIVLSYRNAWLNDGTPYSRALDLFHNRLQAGNWAPNLPAASTVRLFEDGTNAQLGVAKHYPAADLWFDEVLEQSKLTNVKEHTLITKPFPQPTYPNTDPRRTDVMHSVIDSYPESTLLHGDQQYLIHEKSFRLAQRILDTLSQPFDGAAGGGNGQLATTTPAYTLASPYVSHHFVTDFIGRPPYSIRELVRLSTSLADRLGEILVSEGLDKFFSLKTQSLTEEPTGITITDLTQLAPPDDDPSHLSFNGAFGTYYRELFLHIPWLIAEHLNANQQFEDALGWYARIFDPTADESPQDVLQTDRNWRYIEFRNVTMPTLKQILTDQTAIEAYEADPFSPFAIARLRPSAFQKAVVMQYVSNLLDWGDSLFAQDTMESINEATMLYVLAAEILGKRPASLGACETAPDEDLTYEKIGPAIDAGSEFLVQLENWTYLITWESQLERVSQSVFANAASDALASALSARTLAATGVAEPVDRPFASVREHADVGSPVLQDAWSPRPYQLVAQERAPGTLDGASGGGLDWQAPILRPNIDLVEQCTLVFCVPPDKELLKYWDRVEDRLYKIRNCMNISGVRRSLSLFAPEISPMALVRAKAAGLSLEEALTGMAAPVPPYRFSYLVDRARQSAAQVSSFGSSLLSALEKKDVEELTLLKSVHEQTIERMTKDVKTRAVEEAQFSLQAVVENETNVQDKAYYYGGLIEGGLTGWEVKEQMSKHSATGLRIAESAVHLSAAIRYLAPQVGNPFAMKYGGKELGDSGVEFAAWSSAMAGILDAVAGSAGLEASFQRRDQEWRQAFSQAEQELKQLAQTHQSAQKKVDMAQKDLDIHDTTMDQTAQVYAFYKDKFTSLGLYNYLATTLTRLHREAYNAAHDLATLAERAYRYETDDDTVFVAPDNYQFDKAGLLAGERLQLQLQQLESSFVKTNTRRYEMTQSFSLALIQPSALVDLRAKGSCQFLLPEVLFDLVYPGQYKRFIKSVRVTIPCVAGPYTNVSAKLTLTKSWVRTLKTTEPQDLQEVPIQTTSSIATSTAQNDGGLFELNFRDERYLPFEGTGAVSEWRLELPAQLRMFDYDTIGDVIVHVSYTALDDDLFRETVEAQIVDELTAYASANGMQRLFSLRHDFPNAFQQLMHPPGASQTTQFVLGAQHFPYFLSEQKLTVSGISVFLESTGVDPVDTTALELTLNGTASGTWSVPAGTTLKKADASVSGPALKTWMVAVSKGTLDATAVSDVLVLVSYNVS
jgi:hypothetical protein